MNERLQKKIDEIKKNLKDENDFHPLMCFDVNPKLYEVELSADYHDAMANLLEFIEKRDFVVREMPNFLPEDLREAQAAVSQLSKAIDDLEAALEKDYKKCEKEQREGQELHEATWLQNQISEEHFIMVKHLKPHIFEEFKQWVFKNMTEEEIAEALEIIERREREELEQILAADIQAPEFVNPHIRRQSPYDLMTRYMLYLAELAYETDDHFKEIYQRIKEGEETKRIFTRHMSKVLPNARRRLDESIRKLEPAIRQLSNYLENYHRENKNNGNFKEIENSDDEKIGKYLDWMDNYRAEIFIHIKHKRPEIFEGYKKVVFDDMTDEEFENFNNKVAEYEEKKLDLILKAVENEIH